MISKDSIGSGGRDYFMILTVISIFAFFLVWANYTKLDLVTRGSGRVIADGQNKNIQSPERGAFFDEPTSAMDGFTESQVIDHLSTKLTDQTLIIVTHKMPVVAMCDRVIVMDQGKIIGDGSKDAYFDLLKKRLEQKV